MKNSKSYLSFRLNQCYLVFCFMIGFLSYSQNKSCVIYFKDGTKVSGSGKLKSDGQVKFKLTEDSEKILYDSKLIDKVEINEEETKLFRYKKVDDLSSEWLEQLVEGKVCLYLTASTYFNPGSSAGGGMNGGFGRAAVSEGSTTFTYYYISYSGEEKVFKMATFGTINKGLKKTATAFFKDCPIMVEKLDNAIYKNDDIEGIVKFYNTSSCQPTISSSLVIDTK